MTESIVTRAPTRIDLGGGWTDVPPYCDREGGFVCNVAIARYSMAVISTAPPGWKADDQFVGAVLRRMRTRDARLTLDNDFPVAAGLGGSSAASAAMLVAAAEWRRDQWDRREIAELGRRIEVEDMGVAGGRQDHYAACFGGALGLTFGASTVDVQPIALGAVARERIERRSVLMYTGESRISGETITAVLGAYESGEPRVVNALARMKAIAREQADALKRGDVDALGASLDEQWQHQRSLHPAIPTERIDEIVAAAKKAGALGAKAMGASGGGCVLIIDREDGAPNVRMAVSQLGKFVDFTLDMHGVAVERGRIA